jgi:hypothetical protein
MLIIRNEQLDAFQEIADAAFVQTIIEHLREEHAEAIGRLPDEVLTDMVQAGIDRARSWGLTWEATITAFVALMFEIAPNFDEHPKIREILSEESEPEDARLDRLVEEVSEKDWEEAVQLYDENAWFPNLQEEEDDES